MIVEIKPGILQVIILDISGIYAQIYDQGYFQICDIPEIRSKYADPAHWCVLVLR